MNTVDRRVGRWPRGIDEPLRAGWPALLAVALVPIAESVPALQRVHAGVVVVLIALAAWIGALLVRPARPYAVALLDEQYEDRIGAWELSLLLIVVAIGVAPISPSAPKCACSSTKTPPTTSELPLPFGPCAPSRSSLLSIGGWRWGLLAGISLYSRPASPQGLIWLLCFGGYLLVAWISGPGFAPGRTPYTYAPLIVLVGALGIAAILAGIDRLVRRQGSMALAAIVGAGMLAVCAGLLGSVRVFRGAPILTNLPIPAEALARIPPPEGLADLDRVLGGQAVASNRPWPLIAYTQSPAVSIPQNGDAAVAAILDRYEVRWVVIFGAPPMWCSGQSCGLFKKMLADGTEIGRFRLERVPLEVPSPAVFRVTATS